MIFSYLLNMQSHPSWVCGLKLIGVDEMKTLEESHPSWVCGLKHNAKITIFLRIKSHPSWVCGLKPVKCKKPRPLYRHTLRGCVD